MHNTTLFTYLLHLNWLLLYFLTYNNKEIQFFKKAEDDGEYELLRYQNDFTNYDGLTVGELFKRGKANVNDCDGLILFGGTIDPQTGKNFLECLDPLYGVSSQGTATARPIEK